MESEQKQIYIDKIKEYLKQNITNILKEPREFIRYPFIDPGSVYNGNVWDWDTYWSVYGLFSLFDELDDLLKEKIIVHSKGNVFNFLDHQLEDGYIPMMIEVSKWPEPYLNLKHKEGVLMNMHKPFLCQQICLISDQINDYSWIFSYVDQLLKYFDCYDKYYYFEDKGLYVWCDDIMIGMDNDPTSFGRPKFSTANIYLNSFMVLELESFAKILKNSNFDHALYNVYLEKAKKLQNVIHKECWDERDKFFYSVDVDIMTRHYDWFHIGLGVFWNTLPIKIRTWSGFLPMYAGFATSMQAYDLVKHYKDKNTFHSNYGITTLAKDEKMFNLEATNNPSNWLGPIWIVANYIVFRGFLNYGFVDEAKEICDNTIELLGRDLMETGSFHEYYNPTNGEPIMNGGFINWNMLVVTMLRDLEK